MGDRANVQLIDGKSEVFLYTHWGGTRLPQVVQIALARRQRWDDGQYLARIIFSEMVDGDKGETGYGISSVVGDGDDRIITVNVDRQTVSFNTFTYTFEKFVSLPAPNWRE